MIRHFFTPKVNSVVSTLKNTCAIHVRRGDYVELANSHPVLSVSYYQEAQEIVKAKKYLIVSDDISWCKQHFQGSQYLFAENNPPHLDFALMSLCEAGVIIANSTFSWWGAWVNNCSGKIIVAPKTWFGPGLNMHDTKDLIPEEWISI